CGKGFRPWQAAGLHSISRHDLFLLPMTALDTPLPPASAAGAPVDGEVGYPPSRSRAPVWALVVCLGTLITSLIGASLLAVPYVAVRPGKAPPVVDLIRVEGVETYPPEEGTV